MRARRHLRLIALFLAGTLMTPAQEPLPTFRTSTNLVEFTMVVQDRDGKPITDLKKEEVSVLENDQPRETAVFRFNGATQGSDRPRLLATGVFSNRSANVSGPRNFVAIVFDEMNNPITGRNRNQASLYEQMQRYFTKLPPNTRAATYRLKYDVRMLHDFTDDFDALRASMVKTDNDPPPHVAKDYSGDAGDLRPRQLAGPRPESPEMMADLSEATARERQIYDQGTSDEKLRFTLAGLEAIGNQLAGLPGRKSLVWASSGMQIDTGTGRFSKSYAAAIEKTARRLASQGIAIYSVWGDGGPAVEMLSDVTGGRVIGGVDPTKGISAATADQSGAYSLGFYTGEPDARWHRLKVKVSRPGAKVLYQQGYMSTAPALRPQEWSSDEWNMAATRPLGSTEIRFDADARVVSGALQTTLFIAADDLHFRDGASRFDIAMAEMTSGALSNLRQAEASVRLPESAFGKGARVSCEKRWNINPKATGIRLIVHDRFTGAYGSVDIPVKQIPQ